MSASSASSGASPETIGPYCCLENIVPNQWISAQDALLKRPVWLQRRGNEPLSEVRRDLARPGRSRWLQQVDGDNGTWDVYEAQNGVALSRLIAQGGELSWDSMRHWLHDLADEMRYAGKDGTLPASLSVDHVWITETGRALMLEEPWPTNGEPAAPLFPVDTLAERQRFLHAIGASVPASTVPLHARPVLQTLSAGSFEKMSFLVGTLRSLLTKPSTIDRRFRAASLLAVPLFILTLYLLGSLSLVVRGKPLPGVSPGLDIWRAAGQGNVFEINQHVGVGTDVNLRAPEQGDSTPLILAAFKGRAAAAEALLEQGADPYLKNTDGSNALHIAAFFGHLETINVLLAHGVSTDTRNSLGMTALETVSEPWSSELEGIYHAVAASLNVDLDLDRIKAVRPEIVALLKDPSSYHLARGQFSAAAARSALIPIAIIIILTFGFVVSTLQLLCILIARGTLGQFGFGFGVVDEQGAPAGRLRLLARWLVIWLVPAGFPPALKQMESQSASLVGALLLIPVAVWIGALIFAILRPNRGLHDILTGCRLVRR